MAKKLPKDPRDYYVHNDVSLEELAALYKGQKGCSLGNLKARSAKENWAEQLDQKRAETRLKTDEKITDFKATQTATLHAEIEALNLATLQVHKQFMERMLRPDVDGKTMAQALENPFLLDGERVNSLFQTAMNNAVKVLLAALKGQEDTLTEEVPGLIINVDSQPPS